MPQLAALHRKFDDKGLVLIAMHCQAGTDEEILEPVKKNKLKCTVTKGGYVPDKGSGIPHMIIFDGEGNLAWEGHPHDSEAERTIRKELKKIGDAAKSEAATAKNEPLLAERTLTNKEGIALVATVLSVEGENVNLKLKNGQTTSYPLNKLSESDQKTIQDAVAAKAKAEPAK